jgi:hypothetical protein
MSLSAKAALDKLKKDPKLRLRIEHHEEGNWSSASLINVDTGVDGGVYVQALGVRKLLKQKDLVLEKSYVRTIQRNVEEYVPHNKSNVTLLEERIDELTKQVADAMKELNTLKK